MWACSLEFPHCCHAGLHVLIAALRTNLVFLLRILMNPCLYPVWLQAHTMARVKTGGFGAPSLLFSAVAFSWSNCFGQCIPARWTMGGKYCGGCRASFHLYRGASALAYRPVLGYCFLNGRLWLMSVGHLYGGRGGAFSKYWKV